MREYQNLFYAELSRGIKLLKTYPLDTFNSIVSFTIVSVILIIGIDKIGDPQQVFAIFLFPIVMTLISGPSSSIRSDIEIGVFEQVFTSRYSIVSIGIIRSIINAVFSSINSLIIYLIVYCFFYDSQLPFYYLLFVFAATFFVSICIGILLAGLTIKFRKTETLLNLINIFILIELMIPFTSMQSEYIYIVSAFVPFSGIVVALQNAYCQIHSLNILYLSITIVFNTIGVLLVSKRVFSLCMKYAKIKGELGNY